MDTNVVQQTKQKAIMDALVEQRDNALNTICNLQGDIALYKARIQELDTLYADLLGKYQNVIGERDKYKTLIDAAVSTQEQQEPQVEETVVGEDEQGEWQQAETVAEAQNQTQLEAVSIVSPAKQNFSKKHAKR